MTWICPAFGVHYGNDDTGACARHIVEGVVAELFTRRVSSQIQPRRQRVGQAGHGQFVHAGGSTPSLATGDTHTIDRQHGPETSHRGAAALRYSFLQPQHLSSAAFEMMSVFETAKMDSKSNARCNDSLRFRRIIVQIQKWNLARPVRFAYQRRKKCRLKASLQRRLESENTTIGQGYRRC